jgi:hypothetical protein
MSIITEFVSLVRGVKRTVIVIFRLWLALGPPVGSLIILYVDHRPTWIDQYPSIFFISLVSVVVPLVILAWMFRRPRKSKPKQS